MSLRRALAHGDLRSIAGPYHMGAADPNPMSAFHPKLPFENSLSYKLAPVFEPPDASVPNPSFQI
jgi:hypothetical protein